MHPNTVARPPKQTKTKIIPTAILPSGECGEGGEGGEVGEVGECGEGGECCGVRA